MAYPEFTYFLTVNVASLLIPLALALSFTVLLLNTLKVLTVNDRSTGHWEW